MEGSHGWDGHRSRWGHCRASGSYTEFYGEVNIDLAAIDQAVRTVLFIVTTFVLLDFMSIKFSNPNPLVTGLMWVVATTWASIAWYVVGSMGDTAWERWFLDHGWILQMPRLAATVYLVYVMKRK